LFVEKPEKAVTKLATMARCRSELPESAIAFRKFLMQVGEVPVIADFG
jgi:hypothetical protein